MSGLEVGILSAETLDEALVGGVLGVGVPGVGGGVTGELLRSTVCLAADFVVGIAGQRRLFRFLHMLPFSCCRSFDSRGVWRLGLMSCFVFYIPVLGMIVLMFS